MHASKAINQDVSVVTNVAMDHIGFSSWCGRVKEETEGLIKSLTHGTAVPI